MPEYLSPGVYIEEIDAGPKPIEGVSTSTAGAVGVTERGPTTGKPVLVTSFLEFQRKFGGLLSEPPPAIANILGNNKTEGARWWQFPLAVKGFFDNGGQRIFIKRVPSGKADTAKLLLARGLSAEITRDAPAGATEVRLRHTIGIGVGTTVAVFVNGATVGNFTVDSYTTAGVVKLTSAIAQELVAGRDFVEILARAATPAPPPDVTLTVRAKASGDWGGNEVDPAGIGAGNGLRVRVRPSVGPGLKIMASPTVGGTPTTTNVAVEAPAAATKVEVNSSAGFNNANRVRVKGREYTISAITLPGKFTIAPGAVAPIPSGTAITETGSGTPRGSVAANVAGAATSVTSTDVTGLVNGGQVDIAGNTYTVSGLTPGKPVFTIAPAIPAGEKWEVSTSITRMRPAIDPASSDVVNVQNASQLYAGAIVELDTGADKEVFTVDSVAGNAVTLSGSPTKTYFEDFLVRLVEGEVGVQYRRNHIIVEEEVFSNLRFVDDGGPNYIVRRVNEESELIDLVPGDKFADPLSLVSTLAELPIIPTPASGPLGFWGDLVGGRDNLDQLTVDDFVGTEGGSDGSTGIQALEFIDEISICLAPCVWSSTVHSALIIHCETLKDRFAILDPPDKLDIEEIREFRDPLDSKYAALYYPYIEVRDPSAKRNVSLAPSGHMAGIYARVDVERGVHKAPANEVIRGIRRIVRDVSKREQDLLNPRNINALRSFPGRGPRVWGARVITSDAAWKYINVRRLFIFVEESIEEGTQWVVFEPNDEPLWARVRQTVSNFLLTVWRSGALEGTKPDEAFFVKCDRSTMTQADIDNGRLICIIGIAPVKPAEFVIFRIQQKTRDAVVA